MLEPITHSLLTPAQHGFFTRKGGASSGVYQGLNCGMSSSDQAEVVTLNRKRVAAYMGLSRLETVHQVHSPTVVTVTDPIIGEAPKADALVTSTPGLALSILTADCQPVLFHDPEAEVIGAAHAGWRGAVEGVLEATLEAMEELGAHRGRTRAVIGPTISQRNYEIGPEFIERFLDDNPETSQFFTNGENGRYQFDLPSYGLWRLREAGVGEAAWTGHCTYADPDRFFSYRRSCHEKAPDYGRLIAVIRL